MAESLTVRQAESVRLMIDSTKIVNRLQRHIHGDESGEPVELSATQIQAAKILLDKSLPSLQSADITAHSSPQIEPQEVLQAKLLEVIRSNPLLIRELVSALGPHALPGVVVDQRTTDSTSDPSASQQDALGSSAA